MDKTGRRDVILRPQILRCDQNDTYPRISRCPVNTGGKDGGSETAMLGIRTKWISPIGLDIGHDSIKMLQLERLKSQLRVRGAAKVRFPESLRVQDGGGYRRYHFLVDSIARMWKSGSFKGRDVIIGLPKHSYDVSYLCLPDQMPQTHPLLIQRAQEQLGLADASSRIEPFPSGQVREGNALLHQYVVFGMNDQSWLEQRMMLEDMHFHSIEADPIPCAFYRQLILSYSDDLSRNRPIVGVDIGGSTSTVIILNDRTLRWVRHIEIGGEDWTNPIVKKLQLSTDEALQLRMRSLSNSSDRLKADRSKSGRDKVDRVLQDIIRETVEELAQEIQLGLNYYGRRYQAQQPREIVVFGGEAACPIVLGLLEQRLKMKVNIGRCFEGISLGSGEIRDVSASPYSEWSTAIGLCLRPQTAQRVSVPA